MMLCLRVFENGPIRRATAEKSCRMGMSSVKSDTFGLTHTRDAERASINTDTAEFKYFARLQAEWLRGKLRDMDSPLEEFLCAPMAARLQRKPYGLWWPLQASRTGTSPRASRRSPA